MKNIAIILFLTCNSAFSQMEAFLVSFKDKPVGDFNPHAYFHQDAIKAKQAMGLPLYDWYDLPLNNQYVQTIQSIIDSTGYNLRWFNGLVIYASVEKATSLLQLPFVKSISSLSSELVPTAERYFPEDVQEDFKIFDWQLQTLGKSYFDDKNLNGKGVKICIVDVGFDKADLNSLINRYIINRTDTFAWDFALNKALDFSKGHPHGGQVASFVAGKINGHSVGLATEANLIFAKMNALFKTNKTREEAWLKAVEWAHQQGARLVNSSLGYSGNRSHKHDKLTGDSCLMSRAANLSARKGMLVVSSAGNDGTTLWKRIAFPADADSALTVGAISPETGVRTSYSSYGPTFNAKLKPNVSALGDVFWWNGDRLQEISGTSFSSPIITGFAACILQDNPSLKPMDLVDTIQKSSSLYPYFDYSHGYGVPQASKYFNADTIQADSATVTIEKSPSYLQEGYYSFEYKSHNNSQIFYQIVNKKGIIKEYNVVKFEFKNDAPKIYYSDLEKGDKIRVKHRGTFIEVVHK